MGTMVQTKPKIALVTARAHPNVNVDYDMPLILQALRDAGVDASDPIWNDPEVDWSQFDLAILRSTWDYSWDPAKYLAFVDHCAAQTQLLNPPSVVHWNADKHYVHALSAHGVPVMPTTYVAPGEAITLPEYAQFVVKPTVSGGARYAARYTASEREQALEHIAYLHDNGTVAMIQPYNQHIDEHGERALVFLRGKFLHAIRKNAVLTEGTRFDEKKVAHPNVRPWTPSEDELSVAQQALAVAPQAEDLLYARVDLVSVDGRDPVVMELELIEPNLFLRFHPETMAAVVDAFTSAAVGR